MRKIAVYEKIINTSAECPCYILSLQRKQFQNKKKERKAGAMGE